jgi:hypothetical protein
MGRVNVMDSIDPLPADDEAGRAMVVNDPGGLRRMFTVA